MSINYTYTDSDSFRSTVEPGEHKIKVVGYEFGISNQGNDKLDLELRTVAEDVTIYDTLTFHPKSAWKMDTVLKCLAPSKGVALPAKGDALTIDTAFVEKYLKDATGIVLTHNEEYNGEDKTRIKKFLPCAVVSGTGHVTPIETPQDKQQDAFGKTEENVPF
jgi:hypothetical protein